jgi:hypothetical protein
LNFTQIVIPQIVLIQELVEWKKIKTMKAQIIAELTHHG